MAKIGRPSKGERVVTFTRLPKFSRQQVEELASQSGKPLSDVLAALVAIGLSHPQELDLGAPRQEHQDELPLGKAS